MICLEDKLVWSGIVTTCCMQTESGLRLIFLFYGWWVGVGVGWLFFWIKKVRKEMFYLTTHSTHFTYSYIASIQTARKETCCCHTTGYSFRWAAKYLLYAPYHRQDGTYHILCYTSCGALARTRNSSASSQWRISPMTHHTMSSPVWKVGTTACGSVPFPRQLTNQEALN